MNLQLRLELQGSLQQWIDSTMSQYNFSAADMEDAMSKVLLNLKDKVFQDYLLEQQKAYQEAMASSSFQEKEQEEDVDVGNFMD